MALAFVTGCSRSASDDSIESLKSDPKRLKVVLAQCKQAPEAVSERECRAASEAWRQRFFADTHQKRIDPAPGSRP
jgi:hypothetical protein